MKLTTSTDTHSLERTSPKGSGVTQDQAILDAIEGPTKEALETAVADALGSWLRPGLDANYVARAVLAVLARVAAPANPTEADAERDADWLAWMRTNPGTDTRKLLGMLDTAIAEGIAQGRAEAYAHYIKDHRDLVEVMYRERDAAKATARAQGRAEMREIDAPVIEAARRVYGEAHQRLSGIHHDARYAGAISDLGDALAAWAALTNPPLERGIFYLT